MMSWLRRTGTLYIAICVLDTTPLQGQQVVVPMARQLPAAALSDPKRLASVEGVVLGVNRLPLAGTSVSLLGMATVSASGVLGGQSYSAESDALGRFSFEGVEPGRYGVMATHADYSPYDDLTRLLNAAISSGSGAAPASLNIAAGQHVASLEIDMAPMTILSGKVTDENGDPMAGVTVRPMISETSVDGGLRLSNGGVGVKTDADGRYRVTVYSRRWYLSFLPVSALPASQGTADDPHLGYVTAYFPGVREMSLATGIDAAGIDIPELNVRLQKTPVFHVRGKVAGAVNPDSRILPWQETGSARPSVVDEGRPVEPDGTFDIAGLSPGGMDADRVPIRQAGQHGPPDCSHRRLRSGRCCGPGSRARRTERQPEDGPGPVGSQWNAARASAKRLPCPIRRFDCPGTAAH